MLQLCVILDKKVEKISNAEMFNVLGKISRLIGQKHLVKMNFFMITEKKQLKIKKNGTPYGFKKIII